MIVGIKDIKHNFKNFPSHYTRLRSSIRALNEYEMSTRNAIKPGCKDQKNEWDIFFIKKRPFIRDEQVQKTSLQFEKY